MAIKDDIFFLAVGGVLIVGAAWYLKNKIGAGLNAAKDAVKTVLPYVDPTNPANIANSSFNSLYQTLPGETANSTLGGDMYDLFYPSTPDTTASSLPVPSNFGLTTSGGAW